MIHGNLALCKSYANASTSVTVERNTLKANREGVSHDSREKDEAGGAHNKVP